MTDKITPIAEFIPLPWQIAPWRDTSKVMLLTGSAGGGKALDVETDIPTTSGWKKMRDIQVDDYVFNSSGDPVRVSGVTEVMYDRPCWLFQFSNGESVISDADHLWYVQSPMSDEFKVLKTRTIAYDIWSGYNNHIVPTGDGYTNITSCVSINSVPVKCIEIDSEDGLYLCTRSYIATHNSRLAAEKVHAFLKKNSR